MKESHLNASRGTVGKPHYVDTVKFHSSIPPDFSIVVNYSYVFAPLWEMPHDTLNVTCLALQKSWKFTAQCCDHNSTPSAILQTCMELVANMCCLRSSSLLSFNAETEWQEDVCWMLCVGDCLFQACDSLQYAGVSIVLSQELPVESGVRSN